MTWILCGVQMPPDSKNVLTYSAEEGVHIGYYMPWSDGKKWHGHHWEEKVGYITHWQPLPKVPEKPTGSWGLSQTNFGDRNDSI
jgi:Protein of unknown function (DUF551)